MLFIRTMIFIVLAGLSLICSAEQNGASQQVLLEKLKQGRVVAIMRHALAPGTGDPDHFAVGDCSTQRNLSEEGRQQAAQIGERFREYGIASARVYSSQWCRCIDTATELKLGTINELPMINSFFQAFDKKAAQTEQLESWLKAQNSDSPLVLVTHQVNITALTGVVPRSGEVVFVRVEPSGEVITEGSILF